MYFFRKLYEKITTPQDGSLARFENKNIFFCFSKTL
jgi:hypothetical protein